MRLVTWNIRHGLNGGGRIDLEALRSFCADLRPDLLALQEVDRRVIRSGFADIAEGVAQATGLTCVFGPARRLGPGGRYGNALLARGRLEDVEHLSLPRDARREPRAAIVANAHLEHHGTPVRVLATHLGYTRAEGLRQIGVCLHAFARHSGPAVLMGDLNLGPETVEPACADAGFEVVDPDEPSFPADEPEYRIDHIALRGLEVLSVAVIEGPVSDHRAVVAEVRNRPRLDP
jgi:endonuclease/exonuclease/phosphatase family metal-dependent hydrolase